MEFDVSPKNITFLNTDGNYTDAELVILGIPLDVTSTFRKGTKEGPDAIRLASQDMESFDIFFGLDVEDVKFCDLGDVNVGSDDLLQSFDKISDISKKIYADNKTLIALGGEHSLTYPIVKSFNNDLVIHFDAHGDMREDYLGEKWTHASVMKRILDDNKDLSVINFGLRALAKEEMQIIKKNDRFTYFNTYRIDKGPLKSIIDEFLAMIKSHKKIHVTFDLDVLDPSACPGVGNPEPGGLSYLTMKNLLSMALGSLKNKITSFDVVELNPVAENIYSPLVATKLIFDFMAIKMEK